MSQKPDSKLHSDGADFTPTTHHDTYDFIKPEQFNLNGYAVFITGASKGIGKRMALSYARAGVSKIALGARSDMSGLEQELSQAAREAGKSAPTVLTIQLDVTDTQSTEAGANRIEAEFGHLDILINNAGYLEQFGKIADSDPEEWWKVWIINVKGPYLVSRAIIPLMLKGGSKTIVNVGSTSAHVLSPYGTSGYMLTKLASIRFGEFINAEYGDQGILSYSVHPGAMETEMTMSAMPKQFRSFLTEQPGLAGDTFVWLTSERRDWLAGRWISSCWDMKEFLEKREKVERGDLLKIRMDVGTE